MDSTGASFLNAKGNARKRVKISRHPAKGSPAPANLPIMPAASATVGESSAMGAAHGNSGLCQHEAALKTLNTDIDAMRHLVTCQVCHRFMYEPYALSCGHTYCYSCLSQWLGSNRKKTCPDCRAEIRLQPTPSYVIRELVLIFVGRTQLLPDGETSEEHVTMAREEAETVAKDKANTDPRVGGLFKGTFTPGGRHLPLLPIHDPGDGVDRCPNCHWEIEDGYCLQCEAPVGDGFSDMDDSSISSDDELDLDLDLGEHDDDDGLDGVGHHHAFEIDYDGFDYSDGDDEIDPEQFHAAFRARPAQVRVAAGGHPRRARSPIGISSDVSDSDLDADSDEDQGSIEDFIDNEEPHTDDNDHGWNSDDTEVQEVAAPPRRARTQVVISDDEGGDDAFADAPIAVMSDSDDDDDDAPVVAANRRNKRSRVLPRPRAVALSSDDDSSDDSSDDERGTERGAESATSGFSPVQESGAFDESGTSDYHRDFETASPTAATGGGRYQTISDDGSEVARVINYGELDDGYEVASSVIAIGEVDGGAFGVNSGEYYQSMDDEESEAASSVAAVPDHSTDDDDHGDGDSENGWGSLETANRRAQNALTSESDSRAETPEFIQAMRNPMRDARHRLRTHSQRRSRHADALAMGASRQSHALEHASNRRPFPPLRHSTGALRQPLAVNNAAHRPNHPFQLANTLARINNANNPRQPRERAPVRSTSAESEQSSAGGGAGTRSSASKSSSGQSSQTITNAPLRVPKAPVRQGRVVTHDRLKGGYGAHNERVEARQEEEVEDDEY
ncbi:hypothetical protein LTR08_008186 [Meristemomyces frigidus]|nr:hypothetical protein LTR08_008186 [Meristemomyces frigidus]